MSLGHEELVNGRHAAQSKSTDVVQISEKIGLFDRISLDLTTRHLDKPTPSVLVAYLI